MNKDTQKTPDEKLREAAILCLREISTEGCNEFNQSVYEGFYDDKIKAMVYFLKSRYGGSYWQDADWQKTIIDSKPAKEYHQSKQKEVNSVDLSKAFEKWFCDLDLTWSKTPNFNQITEWFISNINFSKSITDKLEKKTEAHYSKPFINQIINTEPHLQQAQESSDAVEFAEWLSLNAQPRTNSKREWRHNQKGIILMTEELYTEFKQSKTT